MTFQPENIRMAVQAREGIGARFFAGASSFADTQRTAEDYVARARLDGVAHAAVFTLSHGYQRKLEVAMLLAVGSDSFMLDEPTAGMSSDEAPVTFELFAAIKTDPSKTVLLVEHKMDVVSALADRIIVLYNGKPVADGTPERVIALPTVCEIYLGIHAEDAARANPFWNSTASAPTSRDSASPSCRNTWVSSAD